LIDKRVKFYNCKSLGRSNQNNIQMTPAGVTREAGTTIKRRSFPDILFGSFSLT
jgi:hypothetical protein